MLEGHEGGLLEILLLAVMLCCILIGSNRGLIFSLYSMVKYIIIVAASIGMAPVIARKMPETLVAREGVGYLVALAISLIIFNLIGKVLGIVNDIPIVSGINKLGGALFGVISGFFVVWSVLAILGAFQEYEWCMGIVKSARENNVVMWFQNCNPILLVFKRFDFPVL